MAPMENEGMLRENMRNLMLNEHLHRLRREEVGRINVEELDKEERELQGNLKTQNRQIEGIVLIVFGHPPFFNIIMKELEQELRKLQKETFHSLNVRGKFMRLDQSFGIYRKGNGCPPGDVKQAPGRMYPVVKGEELEAYRGSSPKRWRHYLKNRAQLNANEKYKFPLTETQTYGWMKF